MKQSQLSSVQNLPGNEDQTVHVACKKPENSTVYHKRTAGFMFIVRPCGVIIDFREMFTSESPSQLFVQLLQLCDEDNANIKYIGYDRACEFSPFLTNLAKKGNPGAAKLLNLKFLVDRFHIKGHTTPECDIKSDRCKYHPDLPEFADVSSTNTECAEQCFAWLKKFKHVIKYMSAHTAKFLLHSVVKARNNYICNKK